MRAGGQRGPHPVPRVTECTRAGLYYPLRALATYMAFGPGAVIRVYVSDVDL